MLHSSFVCCLGFRCASPPLTPEALGLSTAVLWCYLPGFSHMLTDVRCKSDACATCSCFRSSRHRQALWSSKHAKVCLQIFTSADRPGSCRARATMSCRPPSLFRILGQHLLKRAQGSPLLTGQPPAGRGRWRPAGHPACPPARAPAHRRLRVMHITTEVTGLPALHITSCVQVRGRDPICPACPHAHACLRCNLRSRPQQSRHIPQPAVRRCARCSLQ